MTNALRYLPPENKPEIPLPKHITEKKLLDQEKLLKKISDTNSNGTIFSKNSENSENSIVSKKSSVSKHSNIPYMH